MSNQNTILEAFQAQNLQLLNKKIVCREDENNPWSLFQGEINHEYKTVDYLSLDEDGIYDSFSRANEIALEGFFHMYFVSMAIATDVNRAFSRLLKGEKNNCSKESMEQLLIAAAELSELCLTYSTKTGYGCVGQFGIEDEQDDREFNDKIDDINHKLYVGLGLSKR